MEVHVFASVSGEKKSISEFGGFIAPVSDIPAAIFIRKQRNQLR